MNHRGKDGRWRIDPEDANRERLSAVDLAAVLKRLRTRFRLSADTEITIEGRVHGFSAEKADAELARREFSAFTPKRWRRSANEQSVYNRLAREEADVLPFGSVGADGSATIR